MLVTQISHIQKLDKFKLLLVWYSYAASKVVRNLHHGCNANQLATKLVLAVSSPLCTRVGFSNLEKMKY